MGTRYAIFGVRSRNRISPELFAKSLGATIKVIGPARCLDWPPKLSRDEGYAAIVDGWTVLGLPYELITGAGYDLRRLSPIAEWEIVGFGIEDTAAEFWFQHLGTDERNGLYLEVEGQTLKSEGQLPSIPRDIGGHADEEAAWNTLLPSTLRPSALNVVPFQPLRVTGYKPA